MKTPLTPLPRLSKRLAIDLRIKRDDLFPVTGGGSKARKVDKILSSTDIEGVDALVTTGGLQSNHARIVALAAAARGWRCRLVLHGDPKQASTPKGNLLLMFLAGAEIVVVDPERIAPAVQSAVEELRSDGYAPFEVPGGGHSVVGAMALVDAVAEMHEQCRELEWHPEWLIVASGTGATQAGLVVGLERSGLATRVVGISVARRNPYGRSVVDKMCGELRVHLSLTGSRHSADFRDDWVGSGYESAGDGILPAIGLAARTEGLILDPTYSGKAFAALLDLVCDREIAEGSDVLFWHTGGLLNLMASDCLFDTSPNAD